MGKEFEGRVADLISFYSQIYHLLPLTRKELQDPITVVQGSFNVTQNLTVYTCLMLALWHSFKHLLTNEPLCLYGIVY